MTDYTLHNKGSRLVSRRRFITGTGSILGAAVLAGHVTPGQAGAAPRADIVDGAQVPALVVGTGYGGSVAALRLAGYSAHGD